MKRVILCSPIFDFDKKRFTIGGIQTYIRDLADVCLKNNISVILAQMKDEYLCYDETVVDGIKIEKYPSIMKFGKFQYQAVFNKIYDKYNDKNSVFIIDTDQRDIKSSKKNVITIQHGIAFDIPGNMIGGFWGKYDILQKINKLLRCIKNVGRLSNTENVVCVDYNYYNWFRTLGTIRNNVTVIPNYSSGCISEEELKIKIKERAYPLHIIFARRFVEYRGTVIFTNVIKKLYSEGFEFYVTFSGAGPLLNNVKNVFSDNNRVSFTSFDARESIEFHKQFDISVIPTIYSEGTSLSLAEAMSSGCIPIATHVGGMTNMILDNYNGFLCSPTENDLYCVMKKILNTPIVELNKISRNAYFSATEAFSKQRWGEKWIEFLDQIFESLK